MTEQNEQEKGEKCAKLNQIPQNERTQLLNWKLPAVIIVLICSKHNIVEKKKLVMRKIGYILYIYIFKMTSYSAPFFPFFSLWLMLWNTRAFFVRHFLHKTKMFKIYRILFFSISSLNTVQKNIFLYSKMVN